MVRTIDSEGVIEAVECCSWCRGPVDACRLAACDDTPTYDGILRYGEWVEMDGMDA